MNRLEKIIFCIGAAVMIAVCCAKYAPKPRRYTEQVTVYYGDTLWSMADEYCPQNMDKREWIAEVMQLNDIEVLQPGKIEVVRYGK